MRFTLELSENDLRYFRSAIQQARRVVRHANEEEILDAIDIVLAGIRSEGPLPDFVARRIPEIDAMLAMLRDADWALPSAERERLLAAFAYFGDPEDILPDRIPVIGYLDDVIIIELVVREMRHVRRAYADFCAFRERLFEPTDRGADAQLRRTRLEERRRQLQRRMRQLRAKDRDAGKWSALW